MEFKFKITNNIPQRGFIKLTFPSPWTTAPSNIAIISSFNTYGQARTGFNVLSPISSNVVYSGLFDLSSLTALSTNFITVKLSSIANPSSVGTTSSFEITTLDDAQFEID